MEDLKPRPQILAISVPIQPCRRTTNLELNVLIFIGEQGMIMIMLIRHANDDRRSLKQPPFAVRVVKVICPTSTRNLRERWYNIQFKGFGPFACGTYKNLQKRVTKKKTVVIKRLNRINIVEKILIYPFYTRIMSIVKCNTCFI